MEESKEQSSLSYYFTKFKFIYIINYLMAWSLLSASSLTSLPYLACLSVWARLLWANCVITELFCVLTYAFSLLCSMLLLTPLLYLDWLPITYLFFKNHHMYLFSRAKLKFGDICTKSKSTYKFLVIWKLFTYLT